MNKIDVSFTSDGLRCAGWLYLADVEGPAPCIVMAHGLAAVKEMRLDAYAERFAAEGYHVLVFDYRHFGGSEGSPRQLLDIGKQHADWAAAVDYARTRPEVDPSRIVLWGSSLSGGHVMAMAKPLRAVAVIAQVPHTDGIALLFAMKPTQVLRLTAHGIYDLARGALRLSPHYIPASGAPGSLALMTAPEADEYLRLVPPGFDMDQRVAARFALGIGFYSPGRKLRDVDVPVLVQIGTNDQTTPPGAAVKAGKRARNGDVRTYEYGHFEPYTGDAFETFVADQIQFLHQTVDRRPTTESKQP